jgi:ketosteroid isomerase-like protein
MSAERVELVRQAVEAWNRKDADWMIAHSTPDLEFIPAVAGGVEGEGRVVRGPEGFRRFFADLDETWETFEIVPEEFREVGEAVVSICQVHAKGRVSGLVLDQPIAMVTWFRGDRFVHARSFLDHDEAIEAAREGVAA